MIKNGLLRLSKPKIFANVRFLVESKKLIIFYDIDNNVFFASGKGKFWYFKDLWDLRAFIRKSSRKFVLISNRFTLEDLINGKLIKEAIVPNNNCE